VSGWLLDTNVLSELARREPEPAVIAFLESAEPAFVSAVSLHELRFGIERLSAGRRREELRRWLMELETVYADAIIAVGVDEADQAARLRAGAAHRGRALHLADGLIVGTAVRHGLTVVTRDEGDFAELPVRVVNPWTC
jgi:predicted nucleic acid-binding protein